jgi:hypothetical protein
MLRAITILVAFSALITAMTPRTARCNQPIAPPLSGDNARGVWSAVQIDDDGYICLLQVDIRTRKGGTLRIAHGFNPEEPVTELAVDRVLVKDGRMQVLAKSLDKDELWQSVSVEAMGDLGDVKALVTIRDRKEVLFRVPMRLIRSDNPEDFLNELRSLVKSFGDAPAKKTP